MRCLVLLILSAIVLAPAHAASSDTGRILAAYWRELDGTRVSDLTDSPAFPDSPHEQVYLDQLEIPANQESGYGTLLRGYLHPPTSGQYTFFIAANHQAELSVATTDQPSDAAVIATVPKWSMPRDWNGSREQQSRPIHLLAGQHYYIEVRHKNGGGDNHLAVAWRLPDGTLEAPIPGHRLSPSAPAHVQPPKIEWGELPAGNGTHEITATADYLRQQFTLSMTVSLKGNVKGGPALVLLPDSYEEAPVVASPPDDLLLITPARPPGPPSHAAMVAMASAVKDLCLRYQSDPKRIAMVGLGTGGDIAWITAAESPRFYSDIAVVGGGELRDPPLASLSGTRVKIVTDIRNGTATESANRNYEALQSLDPKPEIIFLGEKELSNENVSHHFLARPELYMQLWTRSAPPSTSSRATALTVCVAALVIALIVTVAYLCHRAR